MNVQAYINEHKRQWKNACEAGQWGKAKVLQVQVFQLHRHNPNRRIDKEILGQLQDIKMRCSR